MDNKPTSAQTHAPTAAAPSQTQKQTPSQSKTPSPPAAGQPQVKPLDPGMKQVLNEQIEYLRQRNSGIQSMNYFYEVYKELYNNRVKELLQGLKNDSRLSYPYPRGRG